MYPLCLNSFRSQTSLPVLLQVLRILEAVPAWLLSGKRQHCPSWGCLVEPVADSQLLLPTSAGEPHLVEKGLQTPSSQE